MKLNILRTPSATRSFRLIYLVIVILLTEIFLRLHDVYRIKFESLQGHPETDENQLWREEIRRILSEPEFHQLNIKCTEEDELDLQIDNMENYNRKRLKRLQVYSDKLHGKIYKQYMNIGSKQEHPGLPGKDGFSGSQSPFGQQIPADLILGNDGERGKPGQTGERVKVDYEVIKTSNSNLNPKIQLKQLLVWNSKQYTKFQNGYPVTCKEKDYRNKEVSAE